MSAWSSRTGATTHDDRGPRTLEQEGQWTVWEWKRSSACSRLRRGSWEGSVAAQGPSPPAKSSSQRLRTTAGPSEGEPRWYAFFQRPPAAASRSSCSHGHGRVKTEHMRAAAAARHMPILSTGLHRHHRRQHGCTNTCATQLCTGCQCTCLVAQDCTSNRAPSIKDLVPRLLSCYLKPCGMCIHSASADEHGNNSHWSGIRAQAVSAGSRGSSRSVSSERRWGLCR
jgi:hypothetical protein